eukprot:TRINITY_DN53904_c0_g1_i1.p1 TRINITY_DN53904_c0_g1~~TRINITY_DN53904_c0_g1_i1.p1  ORF type:complete len:1014 (+),score=137.43 TRINITY_DN53904_c0_g1_i1:149-3043(+)
MKLVSDGTETLLECPITVTVETNNAPTCGPEFVTVYIGNTKGHPSTTGVAVWVANDVDGDSLTYTTLEGSTYWAISADGSIDITQTAVVGTYLSVVQATDEHGAYVVCKLNLIIEYNSLPECEDPSPTYSVHTTSTAQDVLIGEFWPSDAGSDPITATVEFDIDGTGMEIYYVDSSAQLYGSNLQAGTWTVTVTLDDGVQRTDGFPNTICQLTIVVTLNSAPWCSAGKVLADDDLVGEVTTINASDADGDTLTFALVGAPDNFIITDAGAIEVTSHNRILATESDRQLVQVEVEVSDGLETDSCTVYIFFQSTNSAPTCPSPAQYTATMPASVGDSLGTYTPVDAEGDAFTVTPVSGVVGFDLTWNSATSELSFGAAVPTAVGNYVAMVTVEDAYFAGSTTCEIEITVEEANQPPQCQDPLPSYTVHTTSGTTDVYIGDFTYSDPEGDMITATGIVLDSEGSSIYVRASQSLYGTNLQDGTWTIAVTLNDGNGGETRCDFSLTVVVNSPPTCSSATLTVSDTFVGEITNVNATDADMDALTYTLSNGPTNVIINNAGALEVTAVDRVLRGAVLPGWVVKVQVSDGTETGECSITLNFISGNTAPACPNPADYTITLPVDTLATVGTWNPTDTDGDTVSVLQYLNRPQLTTDTSVVFDMAWDAATTELWVGTVTPTVAGQYTAVLMISDGYYAGDSNCTISITVEDLCGDETIQDGETCDDGNTDDGDGCSSSCAVESGHSCFGTPSSCYISIDTQGSTFVFTETRAQLGTTSSTCQSIDASLAPAYLDSSTQQSDIIANVPTTITGPSFSLGIRWRGGSWKLWDGSAISWYPGSRLPRHSRGVDCMKLNKNTEKWEAARCSEVTNVLCRFDQQGGSSLVGTDADQKQTASPGDNTKAVAGSGPSLFSFVVGLVLGATVAALGVAVYFKRFKPVGVTEDVRERAPSLVLKTPGGSTANKEICSEV